MRHLDLGGCSAIRFLDSRESILASENQFFLCESTFQKWNSSEDWTRIARLSMQIGEKTRFAQIWPSALKIGMFLRIDSRESIRANLRNVGVRIACPLSYYITVRTVMGGLLGTVLPDLTLESASPSPPQGSIWHRHRVKSGNRCGINVESMLN